jgi:hypothetical protein
MLRYSKEDNLVIGIKLIVKTKSMELYGSIRIKNPKTLQNWIDRGWYQQQLNEGWLFAPNCGRFRIFKCKCSKCRMITNKKLIKVLEENNF